MISIYKFKVRCHLMRQCVFIDNLAGECKRACAVMELNTLSGTSNVNISILFIISRLP